MLNVKVTLPFLATAWCRQMFVFGKIDVKSQNEATLPSNSFQSLESNGSIFWHLYWYEIRILCSVIFIFKVGQKVTIF